MKESCEIVSRLVSGMTAPKRVLLCALHSELKAKLQAPPEMGHNLFADAMKRSITDLECEHKEIYATPPISPRAARRPLLAPATFPQPLGCVYEHRGPSLDFIEVYAVLDREPHSVLIESGVRINGADDLQDGITSSSAPTRREVDQSESTPTMQRCVWRGKGSKIVETEEGQRGQRAGR